MCAINALRYRVNTYVFNDCHVDAHRRRLLILLSLMNEMEYHKLADEALANITQKLEKADEDGVIELEMEGGMVTIALESGKQFIVSKHAPTRQLWLSSPLSGGLHFSYDEAQKDWRLPDAKKLTAVLFSELAQIAGVVL